MEQEPAFKYLRRLTGTYMRARPDDYLPFLALDEDPDKSSQGTPHRGALLYHRSTSG